MGIVRALMLASLLSPLASAQSGAPAPQVHGLPPLVELSGSWPEGFDANARPRTAVLCARSPGSTAGATEGSGASGAPGAALPIKTLAIREAWLGAGPGLVVRGWFGAHGPLLRIPAAAYPRFTDDGRLILEAGDDDGLRLLRSATWVLDPGQSVLRAPVQGEHIPAWRAPALITATAALGGGSTRALSSAPIRVAVDAGHGGSDSGAVGNGLLEKDINLDVALRLADLLDDDSADTNGGGDWDVLLTRASDAFVSLQQRVTLANSFGAASFVSIHSNSFSAPGANGTETYAWAEGTTAAALRDKIHGEMIAAWGLTDRGTKTANFYVLVNTSMPASLSEMGFITNPGDASFLGSAQARQDMALAHLFAMQAHHGFAPYEPGGGPLAGTLKGILYDGTMGTAAPIADGTVALSDGTFTTTNASGFYSFVLSSGSYQFAGTAPGFAPAQGSETVTSGDVWESLGLTPASLPTMTVSLSGNDLDMDIGGDAGSFAWLLFAFTPGLPLTPIGAKGVLWPDAGTMTISPLRTVPGGGNLHLDFVLPSFPGVSVHCQAYVGHQGLMRLSNGAAFPLP